MTLGIQPSWAKLLTRKIVKEILNIIQFVTIIFTYLYGIRAFFVLVDIKPYRDCPNRTFFPCTYLTIGWPHSLANCRLGRPPTFMFSLLTHFRWLEKACYLIDLPPCSFINISRLQIELYNAVYRSAVMRTILWPLLYDTIQRCKIKIGALIYWRGTLPQLWILPIAIIHFVFPKNVAYITSRAVMG